MAKLPVESMSDVQSSSVTTGVGEVIAPEESSESHFLSVWEKRECPSFVAFFCTFRYIHRKSSRRTSFRKAKQNTLSIQSSPA